MALRWGREREVMWRRIIPVGERPVRHKISLGILILLVSYNHASNFMAILLIAL